MTSANKTRFINILGTAVVLALSLLLVAYVGYGEAQRTYPRLEMEKLAAQGDVVRNTLNPFLSGGFPLEQFPGFEPLTRPLLESDATLAGLYITAGADLQNNEPLFLNQQNSLTLQLTEFGASSLQDKNSPILVTENSGFYRVSLPLEDKFTIVGYLHLLIEQTQVNNTINASYQYVWWVLGGILLLYVVALVWATRQSELESESWLGVSYTITFFVAAGVVVAALVNIYLIGIENKAEALTTSLAQRLTSPLELGLTLDDFEGIDTLFTSYKTTNPDIGYITLTYFDPTVSAPDPRPVSVIHTDPAAVDTPFENLGDHIEHEVAIWGDNNEPTYYNIYLGIPVRIIYGQIWRGIKNFVVLFVATAFLSGLFFSLMRALVQQNKNPMALSSSALQEIQLGIIRPFYFLVVFVEGLSASFLPQYFRQLATDQGIDTGLVSTIFTVYFFGFVASLIPCGSYAERKGIRPLFLAGALLSVLTFGLIAVVTDFYLMFLIRFLAGVGQGMLYIAVQSFIVEVATERRTEAAAIIVFGYNGGNISGTAIGALLAVYAGYQGVFIFGAVISLLFFLYATYFIPPIKSNTPQNSGFWENMKKAIKDYEFVKSMLFIGIPTKAVLTGVTVFALPLILSQFNYEQDDIGQILMFYAAGVLISSRYAAQAVDRTGKASTVLLIGTLGSGLGLGLMGLIGWSGLQNSAWSGATPAVLVLGVLILGLSHGFVHAPIVTHVSDTPAAQSLGKSSATSIYRFLERLGHVSGPIIVSQLLIWNDQNALTISYIGLIVCVFGLLFSLNFRGRGTNPTTV